MGGTTEVDVCSALGLGLGLGLRLGVSAKSWPRVVLKGHYGLGVSTTYVQNGTQGADGTGLNPLSGLNSKVLWLFLN